LGTGAAPAVAPSHPDILNKDIDSFQHFLNNIGQSKNRNKVLARVPKGARARVAEVSTAVLQMVLDRDTVEAWGKLMAFTYCVLKLPSASKTPDLMQKSLATIVKNQATKYAEAFILPTLPQITNQTNIPSSEESLRRRVAAKFEDSDIRGVKFFGIH
jgi:hypothetical protein